VKKLLFEQAYGALLLGVQNSEVYTGCGETTVEKY